MLNSLWPWRRYPKQVAPPRLPVNWILAGRLALGPLPSNTEHWLHLDALGLRARFSCCYPEELEGQPTPPEHWHDCGIALPDHRCQEPLNPQKLQDAITAVIAAMDEYGPVYIHCFAGRERSPLVAIGVIAQTQNIDIFAALDWMRRCHPEAAPLFDQLELLDGLLRERQQGN